MKTYILWKSQYNSSQEEWHEGREKDETMQSLLDVLATSTLILKVREKALNNGSRVIILKEAKSEFGGYSWMISSSDEKW